MQAPRRIAGPQAKAGSKALGASAADSHQATFVWRIEHFSRLKDVLEEAQDHGALREEPALPGGRVHLPPHHLPQRWADLRSNRQPACIWRKSLSIGIRGY